MKHWMKNVIDYAVWIGVPIVCVYATYVRAYERGLQMGISINDAAKNSTRKGFSLDEIAEKLDLKNSETKDYSSEME